ncbi:hypothetical protein GCM10007304_07550 [Rhodococcoides trifolii]|uniref:DUF3349 domain-containing protein n=1 Tax=Rhodococcoides trifolii TaxID=908250 RepID=A0A917CSX1_9NOCA|nr:DUF3349 domain-containing protein [Rhodococcus trifolii]GGF96083.1 hypothetical protein GCM10007304_07550 [Rhodococcus trifolii]
MPLPPVLAAIVAWLRTGYPDGVPERDYVPLLALLRRRLTDDEVAQVASAFGSDASVDTADIGVGISKVTDEVPSEADIERVRRHLDDWPDRS